jgi:Uma2 family endonuclease
MASVIASSPTPWTASDLVEKFGPIPIQRIRLDPAPGTATEQDVSTIYEREKRLYELVDGVLVEKTMGVRESFLGVEIVSLLRNFSREGDRGMVLGADVMARLFPGLVRIPDAWFIDWDRLPNRAVPNTPMLTSAPDLAVEVLSPGNTAKEMKRKLKDYFLAGVPLVWFVDPAARTVEVFTAPDRSTLLHEDQILDGGEVLRGFALSVRELFARLGQEQEGASSSEQKKKVSSGKMSKSTKRRKRK